MAMEQDAVDQAFSGLDSSPSETSNGGDAAVNDAFAGLDGMPASAEVRPAATAPRRVPAAASHYKTATKPIATEEPEMSWSEVGQKALRNLVPSTAEMVTSTGKALIHPGDTLNALGELGKGAVSQAAGAFGMKQDPVKKAETERLLNALEEHYKTAYGTKKGFKKMVAEDPASFLMDLSTVLTGGGSAASKALTAGSTAAKAAELAAKAGSVIDPISGSLKIAKNVVGRPAAAVARGLTSKTTGVPSSLIGLAKTAGSTSDEGLRNTFNKFAKGEGTADEIHSAAEDALKSIKKQKSAEYLAAHGNIAQNQIDFSHMTNAWHNAWQAANKGAGFTDRIDALKEIAGMINRTPGTLEHVDALKQQIWDLGRKYPDAREAINEMYAATRDTLANKNLGGDKAYADMMDAWQKHIRTVNDLKKTLGPGSTAASTSVLAKMLKASKTPQGDNLLRMLAKERPDLMYMLSGSALSSWHPGGMRSLADALMASPWLLTGNLHGAAASLAASSPKLVGKTAYGIGAAERLGSKALSSPVRAAAYQAERAQEAAAPEPSAEDVEQASAPRNIRNNNMGNLIDSPWTRKQPGYVGSDGTFAKFESPEAGEAAADRLLENKGAKGLDTPASLIKSWAPDAPPAYSEAIAQALGISPEDQIDLSNPEIRKIILGVIRRFEGGLPAATGGRIERASGGAVNRVNALTNKLMLKARRAKIAADKTTEPLLNEPDHAVVKALDVAQQAI